MKLIIWFYVSILFITSIMADENLTETDINKSISKSIELKDDELKLMYQVFIYKTDLESAYKVAKKALKLYPNDLEWHQKMAEVAQWTDRAQEAMKHLIVIYKAKPSNEIREKLIQSTLDNSQYEKAAPLIKSKLLENPSKTNIDTFSYIWEKAGKSEEAADILYNIYKTDSNNIYALEDALRLYMDSKNLSKTKELISSIETDGIKSSKISSLITYYYYNSNDLKSLYNTLIQTKNQLPNDEAYLRKISDLGWYLGDRNKAINASIRLEEMGKAKLQDYERIISQSDTHPTRTMNSALRAWNIYHKPYFFYTYAYLSLEHKKYASLVKELNKVESSSSNFRLFNSNPLYYMIKAQALQEKGDHKGVKRALLKAKKLKPNDPEIMSTLLWFYMDIRDARGLKNLVFEIEKHTPSYSLFLPLATAHFYLQRSDKAMLYVSKILEQEPNNIDLKFLYSYILQVQNEPQAAMKQTKEIYDLLEKKRAKKPSLMREQQFLDRYLRSAMYIINPDSFIKLLKESKPYLDETHYGNISLFWAQRHNAQEQANMILQHAKNIEPWMKLNQALQLRDHISLQDLLYRYYLELPVSDSVNAAKASGNIAFGYTLAFEGLSANSKNELLYLELKQYAEVHADLLEVETSYLGRGILDQKYLDIENRTYLARGFWLIVSGQLVSNSVTDYETLATVPDEESMGTIMLKKEFDNGIVSIGGGYRDAMTGNAFALAELDWKLSNRFNLKLKGGYQSKAQETTYLMLGGNKDFFSGEISYRLLPSTQFVVSHEESSYNSQDDVDLGDGSRTRIIIRRNFRIGYPDISTSLFAEFGRYDESSGSRGVIDTLMPVPTYALPDDYDIYGLNISYGMQQTNIYTGVWRPYAEVAPLYNSTTDEINLALRGGVAGSIYNQDHLIFGFDYAQAVNGTQESYFKLFLNYKLLY